MRIQRVLLAAAAVLTLAAPAAAFADPHDGSGGHRGDVHRGYDDQGDRFASRDAGPGRFEDRRGDYGDRDGWRFHHRHHHHHRWEDRQWR